MPLIDTKQLLRLLRDIKIQFRRGTAADWAEKNPILAPGEPGYESDTNYTKIGDGVTRWLDLEYVKADVAIEDDGQSLELLYQNAKV